MVRLAQAVVGGTFGSAAKITGTLEGLMKDVTSFVIDENDPTLEKTEVKKPKHFGQGILYGGEAFISSMTTGVTGLVEHPYYG